MPSTASASYTRTAKFLHWLIALAIVGMLALGWIMTSMPNTPDKFALFQWHKSIGITILLLSLVRLGWRLTHKAPPLPADMPTWEKWAAQITHFIFYVLIIGMPLTGWVIVSASPMNLPTILYGLVPWPHLPIGGDVDSKKELGHNVARLHGYLAYLIAGLLVLHIGAAWKHHLFNRDDVLLRMAPKFMHGILLRIRGAIMVLAFVLLASGAAQAKDWVVDYNNSHLGFVGMQGTSSFEGSFSKFTTTIDLDPAKPESGKISAIIDTASATAGSGERDAYLPQGDWFDIKKFPDAQFSSATIRKTGEHDYVADGTLTIKGVTQPLSLPFSLVQEGDHWRAKGKTSLMRNNYHVGEGQWSNENYVKFNVDITIDIAAKPQA